MTDFPMNNLELDTDTPYVRIVVPTAVGTYVAEVLELPGCIAEGDTPDDAYRRLDDAMEGWLEARRRRGQHVPAPMGDSLSYSGHFALRMSRDAHRRAALRAGAEGVSLNQWICSTIAARIDGHYHPAREPQFNSIAVTMVQSFNFFDHSKTSVLVDNRGPAAAILIGGAEGA